MKDPTKLKLKSAIHLNLFWITACQVHTYIWKSDSSGIFTAKILCYTVVSTLVVSIYLHATTFMIYSRPHVTS